jgi:hypothetical protein
MIIELQRQWVPTPEDDLPGACSFCGNTLEDVSVLAFATTDDGAHVGEVCMACVQYLGERNPGRFPTIAEYRALLERYPSAMFESMAEVEEGARHWPGLTAKLGTEEIAARASKVWTREVELQRLRRCVHGRSDLCKRQLSVPRECA